MLKKLIKFTVAGAVGSFVSSAFVKPALKVASGPDFGLDDVVDGATIAVTLVLVDRLF